MSEDKPGRPKSDPPESPLERAARLAAEALDAEMRRKEEEAIKVKAKETSMMILLGALGIDPSKQRLAG